MLVWFEVHVDMQNALKREKAIKEWKRLRKQNLIEAVNPECNDLAIDWYCVA